MAVGGMGLGGWVKKVKGLSKTKKPHWQTTKWSLTEGKGVGEVEEGKGGINGDEKRLNLEWSTHDTIYRLFVIDLYT